MGGRLDPTRLADVTGLVVKNLGSQRDSGRARWVTPISPKGGLRSGRSE
jgi:hypothetical protein